MVERDRGIRSDPSALTAMFNLPDGRRQPVLERKSLAPVPSVFSVLGQLVEPKVDPSDEESELDQNIR